MIPVESNIVVQARTNSSCGERAQLVQHRLFCCFEFMNTRLFTILPHKAYFQRIKTVSNVGIGKTKVKDIL